MKRIAGIVPETSNGRAILVGVLMVAVGLFFTWPPLSLIIPGAFIVALGFITPPERAE